MHKGVDLATPNSQKNIEDGMDHIILDSMLEGFDTGAAWFEHAAACMHSCHACCWAIGVFNLGRLCEARCASGKPLWENHWQINQQLVHNQWMSLDVSFDEYKL